MTRRSLHRRTLLRGIGTAIGLPFLDAMTPAFATGSESARACGLRLVFVYVPNGVTMQDWTPAAFGRGFEFPRILKPLERYRQDVTVLSGLAHINANALGDGLGDHARAAAAYLTGAHPRKTAGTNIRNGVSVDQIVARRFDNETRFPSLELGTEYGGGAANIDCGYHSAYTNSLSWHDEETPLPPEISPRLTFERLFGASRNGETPAEARARMHYRQSVLDAVQQDTQRLKLELGPTDRRLLDEYLYAVRDIEMRMEKCTVKCQTEIDMLNRTGIPARFSDHLNLMYDLIAIAFQTNSTRVATLMVGTEGSHRTYGEIGIPDAHHALSHHRQNPEKIEKITRINEFHMRLFARFVEKLARAQDGNGSLLDNTVVIYGSGIADGDRHNHDDLPVLIAGGRNAGFRGGLHVNFAKNTPMTNLHLTLLDRMGVAIEKFGDSTGLLTESCGV